MLIPSDIGEYAKTRASLSRRVNANSQPLFFCSSAVLKLIKKGEC